MDAREVKDIDQNSIIICPRRGTESPWASKSKDIFISCGVEDLFNIEKLRLYKTEGVNELNDSELFDPLTEEHIKKENLNNFCLLYTSPSPRDRTRSRMPSSA